ncbi:ATP-binding protein [Nocardioides sp. SR21]|uniref:ATP-binding protein n=1 Tax=Nocardioides sp. SR21 TaxID=2919501 RepID=UPI001FAA5331|nr:ATP-binding protein [Nocardioides sp. SR21]
MSYSGRGLQGWPLAVVLIAAAYAAGVGAVLFRPEASQIATWWPAAGIAVALVALAPRRLHWLLGVAVLIVTAAANMTAGQDIDLSLWFGVANAAEALIAGSILVRRTGRMPRLDSLREFGRLVGAAALGAGAAATIAGVGVLVLTTGAWEQTWRTFFSSHLTAIVAIVPMAMTPMASKRRTSVRSWEIPVQVLALIVVTIVVFAPEQNLSLSFAPMPVLVWAALRFDLRTVSWELTGFALAVTYLSAHGYGPFGADYARGRLGVVSSANIVHAYVFSAALLTLPLAIVVAQRYRTLDQLGRSELLFRRNFTESLVGMLLLRRGEDAAFEIVDLNDAAAGLLGGTGSPVGRGLGEYVDAREPLDLIQSRLIEGRLDGWKSQCGLQNKRGARVNLAVSMLTAEPEPTFSAQLQDTSSEYEARRQVEAAEKLTSATLDTVAALVMVTDLYGEVIRVNGATTALTGFDESELVGVEVWDLPFAPPGASGYPAGLPAGPFAQVGRESDVVTKAGVRYRVLWNTSYVRDENDRPTHVVLTGTDLTAERTAAGLNRHMLEAAASTAMIGIDPHGSITIFNTGAANLLGLDQQDQIGTPFLDLLDPAQVTERCPGATRAEQFEKLVAGLETGGESNARDWTWIGADGRHHTVSMTLSVAADAFAARVGYFCVGRDVTEARASQEMLVSALEKERLAVERMRRLDEAKNDFVSTVSHELRTPVTSIVGYTEILEDGDVVVPSPEQMPLLESIQRNGQRLIALCDDLLTLSGLDSGALRFERGAIDLSEILGSTEDAVRPLQRNRDLEVSYVGSPEPVLVLGDRGQLERVLVNLVGNAIKFTEDGGRVECRVSAHDNEAWLEVSDTGIGIPLEEQAELFQRFFRSSTAQQRAIQGTGLGLSIVAAIVAAHGGRIDVRSAHLEGTTFTVRLPLARG